MWSDKPKLSLNAETQTRYPYSNDLGPPFYRDTRQRSTILLERLWCISGLSAIAAMLTLILLVLLHQSRKPVPQDISPHEWNITREMWLALNVTTNFTTSAFDPLRLVVVQHTVSQECHRFATCAAEMRNMQGYSVNTLLYDDVPYNFVVGNDGRVYEGRGWLKQGGHTLYYNKCALGLGFVGDYRGELPGHSDFTALQANRTMMLLEYGVEMGFLHPEYRVVAASDIALTVSPGSNIYNEISTWKHFMNGSHFRSFLPPKARCEMIYAELDSNGSEV